MRQGTFPDADRERSILLLLSELPRRILELKGNHNVSEFVLHSLADQRCFGFNRAAFFVDNPDFDWLKGIVGVTQDQMYHKTQSDNIWEDVDGFTTHMQQVPFNKKVRTISSSSSKRNKKPPEQTIQMLSDDLDMKDPQFIVWNTSHDNQGILLFEHDSRDYSQNQDILQRGIFLLGFCPVF